ncbi:MAG: hypothetical protein FWD40_01510 [Treponema sp.]|nr:hypothetical protein [Treponema sp.]
MFIQSYAIIIILVIVIIIGSVIFAVYTIIRNIIKNMKREKYEQEIIKVADAIIYYRENKDIKEMEKLQEYINIPKTMKITEENNEVKISYMNLIYNVEKGRFIINF